MDIKQMTGIYFSPAGHTKKTVERLLSVLPGTKEELDLTAARRRPDYCFTENEAVLVGVPVFGGRIPAVAAERLKKLHGHRTPAILLVTYGNRAYEDALAELSDVVTAQGFVVMAAAAVIAEHSIAGRIAAGRPDAKDEKKLDEFGCHVSERLKALSGSCEIQAPELPGNRPYRPFHAVPVSFKISKGCENCKTCIRECPVQAISRTDCRIIDTERCISCMRCVHVCPGGHRSLSWWYRLVVEQMLKKACRERKEPEFFYEG